METPLIISTLVCYEQKHNKRLLHWLDYCIDPRAVRENPTTYTSCAFNPQPCRTSLLSSDTGTLERSEELTERHKMNVLLNNSEQESHSGTVRNTPPILEYSRIWISAEQNHCSVARHYLILPLSSNLSGSVIPHWKLNWETTAIFRHLLKLNTRWNLPNSFTLIYGHTGPCYDKKYFARGQQCCSVSWMKTQSSTVSKFSKYGYQAKFEIPPPPVYLTPTKNSTWSPLVILH